MKRDQAFILGGLTLFLVVLFVGFQFNVFTEDRNAPIEAGATDSEQVADSDTPEDAPDQPDAPEGSDDLEDTDSKPNVPAQEGEAPDELVIEDIVEGDGEEAIEGDTVSMDYVGVLFDGGTQFDASWDRGETFDFQLGSGQVIQGWDEGIVGMREGGRRMLIIPADMAYGEGGSPPTIPGGATLIFIVDLREVQIDEDEEEIELDVDENGEIVIDEDDLDLEDE